jgi:hypothetical protein
VHNEELHHLFSSPNIIRMIRSSGMSSARHVSHRGDMKNEYKTLI